MKAPAKKLRRSLGNQKPILITKTSKEKAICKTINSDEARKEYTKIKDSLESIRTDIKKFTTQAKTLSSRHHDMAGSIRHSKERQNISKQRTNVTEWLSPPNDFKYTNLFSKVHSKNH